MELWWVNKLDYFNVFFNVLENFLKFVFCVFYFFGEINGNMSFLIGRIGLLIGVLFQILSVEEFNDFLRCLSQVLSSLFSVGLFFVLGGVDRKSFMVFVYGKGG